MLCGIVNINHITVNTLYGENVEYFNIRPGGINSRQLDLKAEVAEQSMPAAFWSHLKFI